MFARSATGAGAGVVGTESPDRLRQALDGYAGGLDFATALRLFSSKADEGLFTFDAPFASVATATGHGVHLPGSLPGS